MQLAVEGTRAVPKVLLTLTHTNRDDKDIVMMSPRVHLTRNKSMVVCLLEVSEAELYTLTSVIISDAVSIYRFYERYFFLHYDQNIFYKSNKDRQQQLILSFRLNFDMN